MPLLPPSKVDTICRSVINQFDSTILLFYSKEDRKRGFIVTRDRTNQEIKYPFMTISIAIVSNEKRHINNHWQVAEIAAEMKKYAKSKTGSVYVKDRRVR